MTKMKTIEEMTDKEYADYVDDFRKEADKKHIDRLSEKCVKRSTGEQMSVEEATFFYNDFVKELMLYHYPEDSETLDTIIRTYNYLNRWK